MRDQLIAAWLDYVNNYLTAERYAEDHGLTELQALSVLRLARAVFESPHPDA